MTPADGGAAGVRGAIGQYQCNGCSRTFTARIADRKRGWARFCSKSCKAVVQTKKTGVSGPGQGGSKRYPRHDGISEMTHKWCDTCGAPAINGIYTNDPDRPIEWGCQLHHDTTPFINGHGQW